MSIFMRATRLKTLAQIALAPLLVSLAMGTPAFTQTTTQAPATNAPAQDTVTVTGKRKAADPSVVVAAKSRILSPNTAASCNFMAGYSADSSDMVQDYLSSFSGEQNGSNNAPSTGTPPDTSSTTTTTEGVQTIRDRSPYGDARTEQAPGAGFGIQGVDANGNATNQSGTETRIGCSQADTNFAAGLNYRKRNDTKLKDAYTALDAKDYPKAVTLFQQAYDKLGYEEAALELGKLYLFGQGTPQNTPKAVEWFKKVAEARYDPIQDRFVFKADYPEAMSTRVEACVMLGRIYMVGWQIPRNPAEARKWYIKAESIGFVPAEYIVALMYLNGFGGEKNVGQALRRLTDAAELGYVPAQYQLAVLYYNGDEGIAKDRPRAGAWFVKAAKAGNAGALYAVGRMYDEGDTVPADPARALVYYKEAALKGNADAENALATYFYSGEGVPQDFAAARKLFEAAAKQGQVDAMFNLAVMMVGGQGGDRDLAMAYIWFTLAKAAGHDKAEAALKALEPKLSDADIARIDALLNPKPVVKAKT